MTSLRLDQIEIDPTIQIRQRLDESAVERYAEAFDELPPPVVYQIGDTYLLADGMHRLEAANRIGRKAIEVEIRQGTRLDAEAYAITANTKNAVPLTAGERDEGIRRLQDHHGWGFFKIAKAMSLPQLTVERVLDGQQVRASLSVTLRSKSHYEELSRFPEEIREPVAVAAVEQGWNSVELRNAARAVSDPALPTEFKEQILAGDIPPTSGGAWGQILKGAAKAAHDDPLANVYAALKSLALIKAHLDPEMFDEAEPAERLRVYNSIEEGIATLRRVQQYAQERIEVSA